MVAYYGGMGRCVEAEDSVLAVAFPGHKLQKNTRDCQVIISACTWFGIRTVRQRGSLPASAFLVRQGGDSIFRSPGNVSILSLREASIETIHFLHTLNVVLLAPTNGFLDSRSSPQIRCKMMSKEVFEGLAARKMQPNPKS